MDHIACGACCEKTPARPPNKAFWGLIAAFWAASLGLGFAASQLEEWAFGLFLVWTVLATSVAALARGATSWTCAECGSTVVPPLGAAGQPLVGAFRTLHARHA